MKIYDIQTARECLKDLIEAANLGEEILIQLDSNRAVKLLPIPVPQGRLLRAGSAEGLIKMAEDFDAPLFEFEEITP